MKRRELIGYAGAGLLTAIGMGWASGFETFQAQTPSASVAIKWLGHTCFLFTGGSKQILVNPFRTLGCTAKYRAPKVNAHLVLISSQLLDEGAVDDLPSNSKLLYQPGAYQVENMQIQGISIDHDRVGGVRFGTNVAWRWTQAGVNILHLGGAAAPITIEHKILMGRPDVLLIPVGGGPKAYTAQEAKQAVQILNPKLVIPTHYRTQAADSNKCELASIDEFLKVMDGTPVRRLNSDNFKINASDFQGDNLAIAVLNYQFGNG